jgi:MFS family permease
MATEMRSRGNRAELRDRGTGELVKDLSAQVSRLVRQEVELAKTEMAEKGKKAGIGVGMLGGAGVAGVLMLGSLTACLILALALALSAWAAAFIVTALWGVTAGILALQGRAKLREIGKPVPEKTVETVKEDVQWLKNRK